MSVSKRPLAASSKPVEPEEVKNVKRKEIEGMTIKEYFQKLKLPTDMLSKEAVVKKKGYLDWFAVLNSYFEQKTRFVINWDDKYITDICDAIQERVQDDGNKTIEAVYVENNYAVASYKISRNYTALDSDFIHFIIAKIIQVIDNLEQVGVLNYIVDQTDSEKRMLIQLSSSSEFEYNETDNIIIKFLAGIINEIMLVQCTSCDYVNFHFAFMLIQFIKSAFCIDDPVSTYKQSVYVDTKRCTSRYMVAVFEEYLGYFFSKPKLNVGAQYMFYWSKNDKIEFTDHFNATLTQLLKAEDTQELFKSNMTGEVLTSLNTLLVGNHMDQTKLVMFWTSLDVEMKHNLFERWKEVSGSVVRLRDPVYASLRNNSLNLDKMNFFGVKQSNRWKILYYVLVLMQITETYYLQYFAAACRTDVWQEMISFLIEKKYGGLCQLELPPFAKVTDKGQKFGETVDSTTVSSYVDKQDVINKFLQEESFKKRFNVLILKKDFVSVKTTLTNWLLENVSGQFISSQNKKKYIEINILNPYDMISEEKANLFEFKFSPQTSTISQRILPTKWRSLMTYSAEHRGSFAEIALDMSEDTREADFNIILGQLYGEDDLVNWVEEGRIRTVLFKKYILSLQTHDWYSTEYKYIFGFLNSTYDKDIETMTKKLSNSIDKESAKLYRNQFLLKMDIRNQKGWKLAYSNEEKVMKTSIIDDMKCIHTIVTTKLQSVENPILKGVLNLYEYLKKYYLYLQVWIQDSENSMDLSNYLIQETGAKYYVVKTAKEQKINLMTPYVLSFVQQRIAKTIAEINQNKYKYMLAIYHDIIYNIIVNNLRSCSDNELKDSINLKKQFINNRTFSYVQDILNKYLDRIGSVNTENELFITKSELLLIYKQYPQIAKEHTQNSKLWEEFEAQINAEKTTEEQEKQTEPPPDAREEQKELEERVITEQNEKAKTLLLRYNALQVYEAKLSEALTILNRLKNNMDNSTHDIFLTVYKHDLKQLHQIIHTSYTIYTQNSVGNITFDAHEYIAEVWHSIPTEEQIYLVTESSHNTGAKLFNYKLRNLYLTRYLLNSLKFDSIMEEKFCDLVDVYKGNHTKFLSLGCRLLLSQSKDIMEYNYLFEEERYNVNEQISSLKSEIASMSQEDIDSVSISKIDDETMKVNVFKIIEEKTKQLHYYITLCQQLTNEYQDKKTITVPSQAMFGIK